MNSLYSTVAERALHRCEYCGAPEVVFNFPFEVEHIVPRSHDDWTEHFRFRADLTIEPLTAIARVTCSQLRINSRSQVVARTQWRELGLMPPYSSNDGDIAVDA